MHCQHKKKPLTPKQMEKPKKSKEKRPFLESVRNKKTDCPSSLILTVTVPSNKMKRKSQLNCVKISHPTIIKMCFNHDHPVDSAHALSFRPIASQTKESYYQEFIIYIFRRVSNACIAPSKRTGINCATLCNISEYFSIISVNSNTWLHHERLVDRR